MYLGFQWFCFGNGSDLGQGNINFVRVHVVYRTGCKIDDDPDDSSNQDIARKPPVKSFFGDAVLLDVAFFGDFDLMPPFALHFRGEWKGNHEGVPSPSLERTVFSMLTTTSTGKVFVLRNKCLFGCLLCGFR